MATISDYIFNSALNLGLSGVYVGLVNNVTAAAYKSGVTGATGLFTSTPLPGTYTLYTSPTGSGLPPGGDWVATGDTNYIVPVSSGDDVALRSLSLLATGPFTPLAGLPAGSASGAFFDNGGAVYDASSPFYGPNAAPGGGVKVDGVTNDTAAWQAFSNWLTGKTDTTIGGRPGRVKAGISIITAAINFSSRPSWRVLGAGPNATVIRQQTDNTVIFNLGSDTDSTMHSWVIDGLDFDYTNSQPSTNTSALPLLFNQAIQGTLTNLKFERGYYALSVGAGKTAPWGCFFNMLYFGPGLTGGAMDWSAASAAGVPGNTWGHFYVLANNMVGPIFKSLQGENFTWQSVEINNANQGAQWLTMLSGTDLHLGAIKCELGTYAASQIFMDFAVSSQISIGQVLTRTLTISGAGVIATLMRQGAGGGGGHLFVDTIRTVGTTFSGGAVGHLVELVPTAGTPKAIIGDVILGDGWDLLNQTTTLTAESLRVLTWNMGLLSQNKGDADYTIALGDPNILSFETAFTAPRVVNLPAVNNNLHNGLSYTIRGYGAVNGANSLTIKCNAVNEAIVGVDKVAITLTYRRNAANPQGGWVQTAYSSLP